MSIAGAATIMAMMTDDRRPVLQLAHSPDPDDVFMWWPLFETNGEPARLDTGRFRFRPVRQDIESLNQQSSQGEFEITAMSCAQYPYVNDQYALTSCGASMGDRYGPKLVAAQQTTLDQLLERNSMFAIPGERTSAFAALRLAARPHAVNCAVVPFEQVTERVKAGEYPAGLIIHEGQLTWQQDGLHLVLDLGQWWGEHTGLPMPLGVNAIRRDLEHIHGPGTLPEITATLLASVEYALTHRVESIRHALAWARGLDPSLADAFVNMYVNKWTVDFGPTGRQAVAAFLNRGWEAGFWREPGDVDFITPAPASPVHRARGRSESV